MDNVNELIAELRGASRKVAALKGTGLLKGASATTLSRLEVTAEKAADLLLSQAQEIERLEKKLERTESELESALWRGADW